MTPHGCAQKKNITVKLFHLELTTDMIVYLYLTVMPLLKQYMFLFVFLLVFFVFKSKALHSCSAYVTILPASLLQVL